MKKYILPSAHVLFWTLILSFFLFFLGPNSAKAMKIESAATYVLIHFGVFGLVNISIFYVNLFVLIPMTIDRKKYAFYILSILITLVFYGVLKFIIASNTNEFYLSVGPVKNEIPITLNKYFWSTLFPSAFMIGFSIVYKVIVDWLKNEEIQRQLKEQKTQAELQFLKSQINPHFLFNTLNNIYALAYKKSDETPSAILKLSEIMRYMLNESDDGLVDVDNELQYLNSFIDLNRLRYKDGVHINLNVNIDKDYRVMPMLLISFIENIFKHGIVNDVLRPVNIDININNGILNFFSSNFIRKGNKDESSGIGLKNIYRRLDLVYQHKYTLKIKEDLQLFELTLMIKL